MLFVGDTVLENNLMVKFPGSSKKIYRSVTAPLLERLLVGALPEQLRQGKKLPGEVPMGNRIMRVYPGHGDVMSPEMALELVRGV